jgi:integrase/recombinase XerD
MKVEQHLPEYLTIEDIKKAEKALKCYEENPTKEIAILYLMFNLGLRAGEVLTLKRSNFDFVTDEIRWTNHKSKIDKLLPLPSEVKKRVEEYFKQEKEINNAFNITVNQLNYLYTVKLSKYLGRHIKPHLTRHGAGRYLHSKGIPLAHLQDIFGHADIKTTMRYIAPSAEEVRQTFKEVMK